MPVAPLDRESEPYSQYGNISAEGIQRLLGAPHLDPLEILIRETVQNSWDAGKDTPGPVHYRIRFRELTDSEHETLKKTIFRNLPKYTDNPERPIREILDKEKINVLEICDFGSSGLGGPTNPEAVPARGDSPDFVDFLRNIGSPRDTVFGGGTYGYGKSCLYAVSQCQTIIVDTATTAAGKYARRFVACRIASRYDISSGKEKGRYTGRHWWGRQSASGHLEPVTGGAAKSLSEAVGMYPRNADTLGTSIAIVDPNIESSNLEEAARRAIRILLWYCWPKIVESKRDGTPPMTFSVEVSGRDLAIPHPCECPPLNLYANSLRQVRAGTDETAEIRSLRPAKHLGRLHISRDMMQSRLPGFMTDDGMFPEYSSHVALMRPAELVVKYLSGDLLPSENVEWGGVFVCSDEKEVEQAFAAAEPPAHDDWNPRSLPKSRKKTYVRVALARIKKKMLEVTGSLPAIPSDDGERRSLGVVADSLGSLLADGEGQRLGDKRRKGKKRKRSGAVSVSLSRPVFVKHEEIDGKQCALFEITARSTEPKRIRIEGTARIAKDGGGADPTDSRGNSADVLKWRSGNGIEQRGSSIDLTLEGDHKLTAVVGIPAGKAISFNASFEETA